MTAGDARTSYGKAWDRLFELLVQRNKSLRCLNMMVSLTTEVTPATGMVIEFDTSLARQLLDEVDTLTPRISEAIEDVNKDAEKIAKPQIQWRKLYLPDD